MQVKKRLPQNPGGVPADYPLEDCNRINLAQRFIRGLLRLFAPLM